ncbi:MAG: DedA family protein [Anaerolineales bacterium]|nr:MAG: DedA family protein [Anaerolineales bacterium]
MTELNLTDFFLNGMISYGPLVLGLALLLGALGLPMPVPLLGLAAGAFARQGLIDWKTLSALGLMGAVLGDSISYAAGRFAGGWLQRRLGDSSTWQKAAGQFRQHGALAVYVTRFLLVPLAVPTSLIAGSSGYDFRRFLAFAVAGDASWIALYCGLGYIFGSRWHSISQLISPYLSWLAGAIVVGIGIYAISRAAQRFYRVSIAPCIFSQRSPGGACSG